MNIKEEQATAWLVLKGIRLMLSKSAARAFFLGGTALCGVAFSLLTLDTWSQLDKRSHFEKFSPEAARGYETYLSNNCMGCHTLLGEGAYYAPELTKVVSRRGDPWIRAFLKNPAAMYPGRRQMVKYDRFDPARDPKAEQNISDVIAFFKWVEGIDTNGFPPVPDLASAVPAAKPMPADGIAAEKKLSPPDIFTVCLGCHSLGGQGGKVGPALDGVANRITPEALAIWLKDPQAVKPGTAMPNLSLPDATIQELVSFLGQQDSIK
jgi:nitric oxide reductase subunit C